MNMEIIDFISFILIESFTAMVLKLMTIPSAGILLRGLASGLLELIVLGLTLLVICLGTALTVSLLRKVREA